MRRGVWASVLLGFIIWAPPCYSADTTSPHTSQHNPSVSAVGVDLDTSISLHILDLDSGVNQSTIRISVEGALVYDGSTPLSYPNVTIMGSPSDFSLTYYPPASYAFLQVINVAVDAADLSGNAMPQNVYSFTIRGRLLPDEAVERGKNELLQRKDVFKANQLFNEALSQNPNHPKALFWHAITRFSENSEAVTLVRDSQVIDEHNQALFDAQGRWGADLNQPFPNLTEYQQGGIGLLPDIDAALAELAPLDQTFSDTLSVVQIFDLDYGEAKLYEAGLLASKAAVHIGAAYDADYADLAPRFIQPTSGKGREIIRQIMLEYPQGLTLLPGAAAHLAQAKEAIQQSLEAYLEASAFIRHRSDNDGLNHLVRFYDLDDTQQERFIALFAEAMLRGKLADLQDHLANPGGFPMLRVSYDAYMDGLNEFNKVPLRPRKFDINEFLSYPKNVRAYLNEFLSNDFVVNSFSDPTLGQVLPEATPPDYNCVAGRGANFKKRFPAVVTWSGGQASAQLAWDPVDPRFVGAFLRAEIYRSASRPVDSSSQLMTTLTNPTVTAFLDVDLDEAVDSYYYRIYTYYNFGGGRTATAYSAVAEAVLRSSPDTQYPEIVVTVPSEGDSITADRVTVTGSIANERGIAYAVIKVNDGSFEGLALDEEAGGFSHEVPLRPGLNQIVLQASNYSNLVQEHALNVWRLVDITPPTTTATPPGGNYISPVNVVLGANESATIYYTINGSAPTTASSVYASAIPINGNTTLKFFAVDNAGNPESTKTETYIVSQGAQTIIIPGASTSNRSSGWSVGGTEAYAWNAQNWLEYSVDFGLGGTWTFRVTAKNQNNPSAPGLPGGYAFNLAVQIDGASKGNLQVPGSTTTYQTGSLAVSVPAGVHTVRFTWTNDAWSSGVYDANIRVKEVSFTSEGVPPVDPVATPTITPAGGSFVSSVQVSLSSTTSGATIRYTTDGSAPSSSSTVYGSPFTLTSSKTVKTYASKSGMTDSGVASADFTITQPVGTITIPAANTATRSTGWLTTNSTELWYWAAHQWLEYAVDFGTGGSRTIKATAINHNSAGLGLPAGYTFNLDVKIDGVVKGTLKVLGSTTLYKTGSLVVTAPAGVHTVRFTWTNDVWTAGLYDSNIQVKEVSFTSEGVPPVDPVATPTITPAGGSFVSSVQVSLSSTTSGATIRYTTDGNTPNSGSTVYGSPFTLTSSKTVKAYASKSGMTDSAVASADFTITPPAGTITIPASGTSTRSSGWLTTNGTELWYWAANQWLEYAVDFGTGGSRTLSAAAINHNSAGLGLPAGYTFNLTVLIDGVNKGTLKVPGSTTLYKTGSLVVTAPAGVHTVRFTWTNDVWTAGLYDSNIQVKEVAVGP
jgi:hypothetical protein